MVLLPEQGTLEETPLPTLVLDLHRAQFSGTVRIVRDRVEKTFLFRDGSPVFAESNLASESLGVQLIDAGVISRNDYSRVVQRVESESCKEGKALLDLELIAPRGLFLALKDQVRARLVECFSWAQGHFTIEPSHEPPEETQPFRADVYSLIQEGIEAHWGPDRILCDLEPHMNQNAVRTSLASRVQPRLETDVATVAFIDALNGRCTLWKALQRATSPRAMATAWLLDAIGAVEYQEATTERSASPPERTELEIVFGEDDAVAIEEEPRPRPANAAAGGDPGATAPLRDEIRAKFEKLAELDHYELLGVTPDAEVPLIKRRYLEAAKSYHPDALARLHIEGEDRDRASKVFAAIGTAYSVLCDPDRRRQYDASRVGDDDAVDAEQLATAETLYRKGEILLRQGNFKGALEFLQPAVEIYPDECDYQSAAGWALYKKMPSEPELAKAHLEKAAALRSTDGVVLFRLGVVLRALGETVAAATLLAKAKVLDPAIK
ncbi:MAG: DnaJ domain-containing protein [Myxococcota bacterium]